MLSKIIFALLLLPISMLGQQLSVEQDIANMVSVYQEKSREAVKQKDWKTTNQYRKLIYNTITGSTVNSVNLEDQHGELWNLGVLNQPFIVHGHAGYLSGLGEAKLAAENIVAEENETTLLTFLLIPEPENAEDSTFIASISDVIVIVFMEMNNYPADGILDNRLLSIYRGYPITYYIDQNRVIQGFHAGGRMPRPAEGKIKGTTEEEALKANLRNLRKRVKALLKGRKIAQD
jgi:hypothetical protein